jgi:glycosyltransferase involved in cell wall biosynthesis
MYNREKYIGPCLESIQRQTYPNIQILIYDDGSTDRSVEIARQYSRVKIIQGKENKGVSYARNRLMEACDTQYAAWQDSDDISNIYRIEKQYNPLLKNNLTHNFGCCIDLKKSASHAWLHPPKTEKRCEGGCIGSMFFDVEKAKQVPFNERITLGAEDMVWKEKFSILNGEGITIPFQVYYIRRHKQRLTFIKKHRDDKDSLKALEEEKEAIQNLRNQQ